LEEADAKLRIQEAAERKYAAPEIRTTASVFAIDGSTTVRPTSAQAYQRAAAFREVHSPLPTVRTSPLQRPTGTDDAAQSSQTTTTTTTTTTATVQRAKPQPQLEPQGSGADFRAGVWRPSNKKPTDDDKE
jgi:hypothetical protein